MITIIALPVLIGRVVRGASVVVGGGVGDAVTAHADVTRVSMIADN